MGFLSFYSDWAVKLSPNEKSPGVLTAWLWSRSMLNFAAFPTGIVMVWVVPVGSGSHFPVPGVPSGLIWLLMENVYFVFVFSVNM